MNKRQRKKARGCHNCGNINTNYCRHCTFKLNEGYMIKHGNHWISKGKAVTPYLSDILNDTDMDKNKTITIYKPSAFGPTVPVHNRDIIKNAYDKKE